MTRSNLFDRRSMCVTFVVQIILLTDILYQSRVHCIVPPDLKPISMYDIEDTTTYPAFSGVCDQGDNNLQDIQGVKNINETYYVYARDYIYVVNTKKQSNGSTELVCSQTIHWPSLDSTIELCKRKGQSSENCHNYVKLFEQVKTDQGRPTNKVLVCGTNSFEPTCRFYTIGKDGHLQELNERALPGNLACPFDPNDSLASVMSGGNLYTATQSNFGGTDALIYRSSLSNNNDKNLRTIKGDTTMLNDPEFIKLVDGGLTNKMFVFFTETAIEDNSNQIYSRIGQMCKNDQGGQIVLRNQFSSFFKTRLNCSLPGQPPFYFNELRDVTKFVTLQLGDDPKESVVFTIMNTPGNSIPASAICVFTAKDIQSALTGPFNEKSTVDQSHFTYWDKLDQYPKPHLADCGSVGGTRNLNSTQLNFVRKHPMMYNSVPAWNLQDVVGEKPPHNSNPIFSRTSARNFLTSLAVDTMAGFVELYTVVLAGTEDGKVIKIVILKNKSVSVVEERVIFNEEKCGSVDKSVRSITINKENGTMLITFKDCFISAPLCPLVGVCARNCIASRDPYCVSDGTTCLSSHQRSQGNSTKSQVFNSVDTGNVDWLPPCPKSSVAGKPIIPDSTSTVKTPVTTPKDANKTVIVVPTPVKIEAASTEGWLLPVLITLAFIVGLSVGIGICLFKKGKCIKKNINNKKKLSNGKVPNGQSRDNRRDSNIKKSTSTRRESSNSQNRQDEFSRRSRKITETSVHNKSDDDREVFLGTPDSPDKRMSDTFRKKHLSVSSQGGRRRARNSKPSTSSAPEADESLLSSSQKTQYQADDQNTRGSSDSGHSSEGLLVPPENIYNQTNPPTTMSNQRIRPPPMRSASFQGHQNIPRSHTMDNYSRNGRRPPMDRQLSLQQGIPAIYATNPPFRHPQPHGPMGPPWPHTAQPVVQGTPNKKQYGGPSNRMTASLDRRMMKNKGHYQVTASPGDVFNEEPIISNNNAYQPQRKRYASESMGMQNPQMVPPQYQQMRDEQKPILMPINEEHHMMEENHMSDKNRLRLNLPVAQEQANRGSSSAPVMFNRSQNIDNMPIMGARGPFMRRNVSASNPGTPVREIPPNFMEVINNNKGHATLPTNPKMQQRFQPQPLNLDKRLSDHPSGDMSPSKSTPTSPLNNSYFNFPNQEKMRHSSGQKNSLTPTSGENQTFLGQQQTPGPNNQRTRHSSGPIRNHTGQVTPNDIPMAILSTNNRTIVT